MKKEMLINVLQPEETRIAILEDGTLEELYVEREAHEGFVGNIYKGKVVNIEASIQAVFVDFGVGRNGFLHISDVDLKYYGGGVGTEGLGPAGEAISSPHRESDQRQRPGDSGGDDPRAHGHRRRPKLRRGRQKTSTTGTEESAANSMMPSSDSLPDLENFRIEDEVEFFGDQPTQTKETQEGKISQGSPESETSSGEIVSSQSPIQVTTDGPEEPVGPEELDVPEEPEEDAFGFGILAGEEDESSSGNNLEPEQDVDTGTEADSTEADPTAEEGTKPPASDEEDPPLDIQPGVPRRTVPSDDEDEDSQFGSGLFDDEIEQDDEIQPEDQVEEPDSLEDRAPDSEDNDISDDQETITVQEPGDEDQQDQQPKGTQPRRRRRRGGRRRSPKESEGSADAATEGNPTESDSTMKDAPSEDTSKVEEKPVRTSAPRGRPRQSGDSRPSGRDGRRGNFRRPREYPPIQSIFRKGQEVLVQVIKEGIGNKGPTLSTFISIPGRYLVLMPGLNRVGVSRKIIDEEQRRNLRDIVIQLDRPKGVGIIVRTAGIERTKEELENDLSYLARLWEVMVNRIKKQNAPAVTYQESDMIIRTIRDIFVSEIDTIWIDEKVAYERAREFLKIVMPDYVDRLKLHEEPVPLFHHFGIEEEIAKIQRREVPLPRGGSIVIEQTEALVAIDVNSGRFRAEGNAEETAYQINLTAAKEIARQLRLRDLGGVIVNDFIDMREDRHRRSVENSMREAVKRDRARTKVLRISPFGIIEMTRQRIRPSLKRSFYRECPMCRGSGQVKNSESMGIESLRLLTYVAQQDRVRRVDFCVQPEIAEYLHNQKRRELAEVEEKCDVTLTIRGAKMSSPEDFELCCRDERGKVVEVDVTLR